MNLPTHSDRWILFLVLPLLFSVAACGSDEKKDGTTAEQTTVDSTAIYAEIDQAITDYNAAADSFAVVLAEIKTVEDVERQAPTIQKLSTRMDVINQMTAKYGEVLLSRMELNPVGPSFDRITSERERINAKMEVAKKLAEVEAAKGSSAP